MAQVRRLTCCQVGRSLSTGRSKIVRRWEAGIMNGPMKIVCLPMRHFSMEALNLAFAPSGAAPNLWHQTADFLDNTRIPFVGFNTMSFSNGWDWNLPYNNPPPFGAMLKGALMASDYSIVAIWNL